MGLASRTRTDDPLADPLGDALVRRSVGALGQTASRCADCGRTPLTGEQVHHYEGDRLVCELCRPMRGGVPERTAQVAAAESGLTVRVRRVRRHERP